MGGGKLNCQIPNNVSGIHVGLANIRHSPEQGGGYSKMAGDYDMMHMACESPPPDRSVSTGISNGWLDGISKDSFEGAPSPSLLGSRNVKSRNESMARNVGAGRG